MCELWFYWGKFVCGSRASHGRAGDGFKRWDCAQWSFFFFFLPLLPAWSLHFTSGSLLHSSCWLSVKTAQKYWIIALLCFNCFLERSMYHVAYTHVSWELAKAALQMSFCVYSAIYGEANDRKCKSWHFHISNGKSPPPHFQSQPVAQADTCFIPSFVRQSWECRFPPKEFLFQWLSFSYYYVY